MVRPFCFVIRTTSQTPDISSSMSKSLPPPHLATGGTVVSLFITFEEHRSPRLAGKVDDNMMGYGAHHRDRSGGLVVMLNPGYVYDPTRDTTNTVMPWRKEAIHHMSRCSTGALRKHQSRPGKMTDGYDLGEMASRVNPSLLSIVLSNRHPNVPTTA